MDLLHRLGPTGFSVAAFLFLVVLLLGGFAIRAGLRSLFGGGSNGVASAALVLCDSVESDSQLHDERDVDESIIVRREWYERARSQAALVRSVARKVGAR